MHQKKIPIDSRASKGKTVFSRKRGILTVLGDDFSNM
jgi:hypothetical protein